MNGQHLRAHSLEDLNKLIAERWKTSGMPKKSEGPFVDDLIQLLKDGIDLITDADTALSNLLSYPLRSTLHSNEAESVIQDNLLEFCVSFLVAYDSGDLLRVLEEGQAGWKNWVEGFGKSLKRKGKSLFMPLRLLLTEKLHRPNIGATVVLLYKARTSDIIAPEFGFVTIDE